MLPTTSTGAAAVRPSGLLAGMMLFTTNTVSAVYAACDEASVYFRLIADAPNTSNTAPAADRAIELPHTDAGFAITEFVRPEAPRGFRARDAIFELRRFTGLTWEELAKLLSVTRRSLHLWANGHPINAQNETRLRDLMSTMRALDRGTARENRALLMSPRPAGGVFSDLLRDKRFDEALLQAGRGKGRPTSAGEAGSAPTRTIRLSVQDRFSTRSDRVHIDDGIVVRGRIRKPRQA